MIGRRPDEQKAVDAVFDVLRQNKLLPQEDTSIIDNPDLVFELNGIRIAADCTNINLQKVMQWSNSTKHYLQGENYEIRIPLEPHYWIKESIREKEPKLERYKTNGKARYVWLIVHSVEKREIFDCSDSVIAIMTDAVRFLQPKFDKIWFVHTQRPAILLWQLGDPKINRFPSWSSQNEEYPCEKIIQFKEVISQNGLKHRAVFGKAYKKLDLPRFDKEWKSVLPNKRSHEDN